ncbi:MAG: hypothetical protein R2759_15965 [Bacteroidales bacterium]
MITLAEREGRIKAVIARSCQFLRTRNKQQCIARNGLQNHKKKQIQKANWFCTADKVHSYTYTPDAARATAMLGNDEKAYGQTWHLPTSPIRLPANNGLMLLPKN